MIYILRDKTITEHLIKHLKNICYGDGRYIYQVDIKQYKAKRSVQQNKLLWLWYREIANHVNYQDGSLFSDEDMHDWFRNKLLETKIVEFRGEIIRSRKSTTKLTVSEFIEYLDLIDIYCADNLGLVLPHPDDLYWASMGLKQER